VPVAILVHLVTSIAFAMAERQEETYEEEEPLMFDSSEDDFRDLDIKEPAASPGYGELGDLPEQRVARNSRVSEVTAFPGLDGDANLERVPQNLPQNRAARQHEDEQRIQARAWMSADEVPLRTQRSRELFNAQTNCHEAGISGPVDGNLAAVMAARVGDRRRDISYSDDYLENSRQFNEEQRWKAASRAQRNRRSFPLEGPRDSREVHNSAVAVNSGFPAQHDDLRNRLEQRCRESSQDARVILQERHHQQSDAPVLPERVPDTAHSHHQLHGHEPQLGSYGHLPDQQHIPQVPSDMRPASQPTSFSHQHDVQQFPHGVHPVSFPQPAGAHSFPPDQFPGIQVPQQTSDIPSTGPPSDDIFGRLLEMVQ
jgi:hypothetical protein